MFHRTRLIRDGRLVQNKTKETAARLLGAPRRLSSARSTSKALVAKNMAFKKASA
jgi:hypothetical protein